MSRRAVDPGPAVAGFVWLAGVVVWGCAAVVAVLRPDSLAHPFLGVHGLPRTDTTGAVAFAGSALALFVWGVLRVGAGRRRPVVSLARVALVHGLLGAAYIAGNLVTHPWTLSRQLTHLASWPTEAQFGLSALGVAVGALVILRTLGGRVTH